MQDTTSDGQQPRCPNCQIVMRDVPGAWKCPSCGHTDYAQQTQQPQLPDVPTILGG